MQDKGLNRTTIDKFYTKSEVVELCMDLIDKYLDIKIDDLIIEPSAGNGAFIEGIKCTSNKYKFYDIEPEHDEIIKKDFLGINHKSLKSKYENIHIIGNPPFGRQSSMAIKFIKKCCKFANSISFILPKSFKKDSMRKYFTLNYHLIYETNLEPNSFLVNGIETDVPCVFQIWILKDEPRIISSKSEPINFKFVKKEEDPDISFRRVGVNAGTILKDVDKNTQSHYFIKFINNDNLDKNLKKLKNLDFKFDNTVGPKSISKSELIDEFNKLLI